MEESGDGDGVCSWWCLEELDFEGEIKRKLKEVMMMVRLEVEIGVMEVMKMEDL